MTVLLIVNVGVVVVTGVLAKYFDNDFLVRHLGLSPHAVVAHLELWQPFTYFWLHSLADPSHLIWNLLTLWLFSGPIERSWGAWRFLRFYVLCGVGSGLVVLAAGIIWQPDALTVGASGAILGLVAAFGVLFPDLPVYLFGLYPMRGRTLAIAFAVISTAVPLLYRGGNVSIGAHLGGLAIGALVASGYWDPRKLARRVRAVRTRHRLRVVEGGEAGGEPDGRGNGRGQTVH